METHHDRDAQVGPEFFKRLEERAGNTVRNRQSEITAGKVGEAVLAHWNHDNMHVVQRPADEQRILRISIGGGIAEIDYCVFRGDRARCALFLERALKAMRHPAKTAEKQP